MTKQCKDLVTAVVGMLLFATLTTHAQNAIQPVQALTVVDANGKQVGNVLGIGGDGNQTPVFNVVAFKAHKNLLTLGVVANGFIGTDSQLFFTSFDCSGSPSFSVTGTFPAPFPDTARRTAVMGGTVGWSPEDAGSASLVTVAFVEVKPVRHAYQPPTVGNESPA